MPGLSRGGAALLAGVASMSEAAGHFAASGANITAAFATVAVATSQSALGLAEEAWKGVDLLDLYISVEQGSIQELASCEFYWEPQSISLQQQASSN